MTFKQRMYRAIVLLFLFAGVVLHAQEDPLVWPKDIIADDYVITLYKPQNTTYINSRLKSNLAFAVKRAGTDPKFGMLWVTSLLDVDRTSRIATLVSVQIDELRFAETLTQQQKDRFETFINDQVPEWALEFPLDSLLESLQEVSAPSDDLKNDPPKILFADEPTALILIDGEARFREAEKGYELVENTGAFIAREKSSGQLYLRGGAFWYTAASVKGPWKVTEKIPSRIQAMAKKAEAQLAEETEEGEEADEAEASDTTVGPPAIRVAFEPTELVAFSGEPEYSPVQGTSLLQVTNTSSDIFMHVESQTYYLLISGRWFATQELDGEWSYVDSLDLPEDFGMIPPEHEKAHVLASVAGTDEARNAVYDAQIPQTAAVDRDTKATEVLYNGSPEFKRISDLQLEYAVNTESAVFRDRNTYYLLDNAIWFEASSPNGPWIVADQRPQDIDKIPADNPRYNTKYVYIYETSPSVVYVGYTPGYYGSYVYGPTVVYGTGFYYNPWYSGRYYHHHYTYGFSVRYNPWYGWSFGFGFGSPYSWYGNAYWGFGYHYWGPRYYRPPYYYRNRYRRTTYPIYRGRRGVRYYNRPATRPNTRPGTRPNTRPSTRPNTRPGTRPNTRPETRPNARPETRPNTRPSTRPNTRPSTRPNTRPETRPGTRPTTRPSTRPTPRPTVRSRISPSSLPRTRPMSGASPPMSRPGARPASRPLARPSGRARGGRGGF